MLQPGIRNEACQGLYKLCLGKSADGATGYQFLQPVLAHLLTFLDDAHRLKTVKKQVTLRRPYH